MKAPTLLEFLEGFDATIWDHMKTRVEAATFQTGLTSLMCGSRPTNIAQARTSSARLMGRDLWSTADAINACGATATSEGGIRSATRIEVRFADIHLTIHTSDRAGELGLSDIRFASKSAMRRALEARQRVADDLGLAHLRRGTIGGTVRINGGEEGWMKFHSLATDLTRDPRDFAGVEGHGARHLVATGSHDEAKRTAVAAAVAFASDSVPVDLDRRSRGLRAASHVLAVFDPCGRYGFDMPQMSGSATLAASLDARSRARRQRIVAFLEATGASTDLVAAWSHDSDQKGSPP